MASYLQKLRNRQSKQPAAQKEPVLQEPPKVDTPTVDASKAKEEPKVSGSTPASHVPTVTGVSDEPSAEPVLDEEDERFLERLAAIAQEPEGTPPPLPTRPTETVNEQGQKVVGKDAQEALMAGADKIALPQSPAEGGLGRKKSVLSYFTMPKFKKGEKQKEDAKADKGKTSVTDKDRAQFADDLLAAAESSKSAELTEEEKEKQDLTKILEELNLSAVNNRVFSFTKESEELLHKFTLVLKDIVNGVPTAYNDLEKLFTDYDTQLKKMYGNLPPFLQNLVKGLPAKLTASLGPEFLAAQAEKPGFDAKQRAAGPSSGKRSKIPGIPTIPSLKQLVTAQGAVATALRSILNFLKFRFPALATGTNLLMSLAVFLLLFVFWYCHKRGRETRLEKERLAAENSAAASSASSMNGDNDSIFGDKKKPVPVDGQPTAPLIISDGKEEEENAATVKDLPSVAHLPDPTKAPVNK